MHLFTLKAVTKKFNDLVVLKNINLTFDVGEFVVVVGKSGCGKSTLLNILDYSLKVTSGKVLFQDKQLNKRQIKSLKQKHIRKVYQNHNLIPYYTVYDNLLFSKVLSNGDEEEIGNFISYFELDDLKDRYPDTLSGGERQRVSIIRALLDNPLIVFADEPTGSLDEENSKKVLELLKKNKEGKLIVLVTHDEKIPKKYADRIIYINEDGSIKDERIKDKTVSFEINIEKKENTRLKKIFKLNLKSLIKRKSKIISLIAVIFLITSSLSLFLGLKKGINAYIDSLVENRIDKNTYQVYYESNEGIIDNKDILENTSFKYEKSISYQFILNNVFINDFYIFDKNVDEYFEVSLVYDEGLNNYFYMNNLMRELMEFNEITLNNSFINQSFFLKEIIEESNIYNSPRIYMSYQYMKELIDKSKFLDFYLNEFEEGAFVYDYYIFGDNDPYEYLSKKCVSIYKGALSKDKNFYVFNNSKVMIKESFQELFDTILLIVEMLGSIIFFFLFCLTYLLIKYIYSFRKLELGIMCDLGGDEEDLSKLLLSDLGVVSLISFLLSFIFIYLISLLIKQYAGMLLLDISIGNTLIVYGVVVIALLVVVFAFILSKRKEDLSLILKEENIW